MKVLPTLLLAFNWRSIQNQPITSTSLSLFQSKEAAVIKRNEKIEDLLNAALEVGQVGSLATEEEQKKMVDIAKEAIPLSDSKPAKFPLVGEHKLVYSAAPGASSGRLFGKVVGKVTQFFEDDKIFYNRVNIGPVQIALKAEREIKNDTSIKVTFLETKFFLFGKQISENKAGGGGVWKVKFAGKVKSPNGEEKIVRIMETPSLFVLEQPI